MAIRMKNTVTLRSKAECPSHSRTDVTVRDVNFTIDEPTERGGTNLGPTPTDTAIAALIACTNVIGNKCAKKLGVDIGHLTIDASCQLDRRGVLLQEEIEVPFQSVTLDVASDGPATEEELQQVATETAKFCALSKLFENSGSEVSVNWSKKG